MKPRCWLCADALNADIRTRIALTTKVLTPALYARTHPIFQTVDVPGDYTHDGGSNLVFVLRVPVKQRLNLDLRGARGRPAALIEKQIHP